MLNLRRPDYADKSWQTDTSLAAPTGTFQSRQVTSAASSVVRWRSLALMLAQGVCAQDEISSPFLLHDKTVQRMAALPAPDHKDAPVLHTRPETRLGWRGACNEGPQGLLARAKRATKAQHMPEDGVSGRRPDENNEGSFGPLLVLLLTGVLPMVW